MSADIEKLAVFDDRIVQSRPRYAVEKGALSVTNSPFNAIAANTSQHTYNVLVPSENVFIDRSVDWTSTCYLSFQVTVLPETSGTTDEASPLAAIGTNLALCPFPLQSLTTTMTATINDTTVTINSADVLPQVLRMTDYKKNRLIRTCPTMLDRYQKYSDIGYGGNSPLNGFASALNVDEVPNGAFSGLEWTTPAGQPLSQLAAPYTDPTTGWVASADAPYPQIPVGAVFTGGTAKVYTVYARFTSCEKLVLSPFVFSDIHEWDTGLFGCQNIQLVMNLSSPGRVLRSFPLDSSLSTAGSSISATLTCGNIQYNTSATNAQQAFAQSRVNLQFLTPSLDVPLPPKSVVPYMEFPRYISGNLGSIAAKSTLAVSSQTITLPQIPDLLIIYAKPVNGYVTSTGVPDLNQGDWMVPISNISVNFDNFSGLLSSHTQQQLYKMSVHNGLEMDWLSWSGLAYTGFDYKDNGAGATQTALVGGMLVLKPGRDIVLQAGQAPSLVGNFVLQFNITLVNNTSSAISPQLYVITANSGFFETIKGSSRVIKGVLTEQDIISAPVAPGGTTGALRRAVGGNILGSLGNALSRVKGMFHRGESKAEEKMEHPKVKASKGMMPGGLASRLM